MKRGGFLASLGAVAVLPKLPMPVAAPRILTFDVVLKNALEAKYAPIGASLSMEAVRRVVAHLSLDGFVERRLSAIDRENAS